MGDKLIFCKKIYWGDGMKEKNPDKLKRKIEKNPLLSKYYIIAFSDNPNDQLDIMSARQLVQPYYSRYPLHVIGVASGYDEALAIVEKMAQECLQVRGDCALGEYLACWR